MKILTLALVATALAATPIVASAKDSAPNSPAERTAALLAAGSDIRINQVAVQVEAGNPEDRPHHHHRPYHTVKVVKYRNGEKYVTYRRVYD
jgi:hypothetical protein